MTSCGASLVALIAGRRLLRTWGFVLALASMMGAPSASWSQRAVDDPSVQVEIRFLDVGQGDAVLIRLPNGRHILVDAGRNATDVAALLAREGVDTIELVVASHNHADHIGGLAAVLEHFVVRNFLDNGIPAQTGPYRRLEDAVVKSGAKVLEAKARTLSLGTVKVRVLSLPPRLTKPNDNSVGLLLQYGEFRALLTGDSERRELAHWLANDSIPTVSLLKVAHHGAKNGTTLPWMEATRPLVAVISVGRNGYGMPAAEVLDGWRSVATHVALTLDGGTVIVRATRDGRMLLLRSDGTGLIPRTSRYRNERSGSNLRRRP